VLSVTSKQFMLYVVTMSVVMMSVVMPSVIMLTVVVPFSLCFHFCVALAKSKQTQQTKTVKAFIYHFKAIGMPELLSFYFPCCLESTKALF